MLYAATFELTGTEIQQNIVKEALDKIKFPWEKLNLPNKPTEIGWKNLNGQAFQAELPQELRAHAEGTIGIIDGRKYTLGVFYTHSGRIYVDNLLVRYPDMAQTTVSAEIAHAVDYFLPLTEEMKTAIMKLTGEENETHTWWEKLDYGDEYYSLVGESFMQMFTVAYSTIPFPNASSFVHNLTPEKAPDLRKIMGVERTDVNTSTTTTEAPVTTTVSETTTTISTTTSLTTTTTTSPIGRFFGSDKRMIYHDAHKGCVQDVTFATIAEAEAAGYRACKVCRPK